MILAGSREDLIVLTIWKRKATGRRRSLVRQSDRRRKRSLALKRTGYVWLRRTLTLGLDRDAIKTRMTLRLQMPQVVPRVT